MKALFHCRSNLLRRFSSCSPLGSAGFSFTPSASPMFHFCILRPNFIIFFRRLFGPHESKKETHLKSWTPSVAIVNRNRKAGRFWLLAILSNELMVNTLSTKLIRVTRLHTNKSLREKQGTTQSMKPRRAGRVVPASIDSVLDDGRHRLFNRWKCACKLVNDFMARAHETW